MKKYFVLIILTLMLTGCANWQAYNQKMADRFHGQHVDYLVVQLGVPTGRIYLSDGGQVIEYITYRGQYRCESKFIADSKGIVTSSSHGGQNGCTM